MDRSMKRICILGWLSASAAVLLTAAPALAQDATVGVGATTTIPSRSRTSDSGEGRTEGRTEGRPAGPVASGMSAHEAVVGRIGVSWLGTVDVPVGPATAAATPVIPTPVVGIRYWLNSTLGIDAGLGFFTTTAATRTENNGTINTLEAPTRTTFVLHGGVPISLGDVGNFAFRVIPEINLGIGMGSIKGAMGAPNTDLSGFLLEGGARAGAEIFFGFIGIPQLSLEGTVGLFFSSSSGKTTLSGNSTRFSSFVLSTSSVAQPWDIFRKDIAARYYF
jgi:hypothetical protein